MDAISQTTTSKAFSWMKIFEFQKNFIEICSLGCKWQYDSIVRRQAIFWTNDDSIHRRIYAALGGDELIFR